MSVPVPDPGPTTPPALIGIDLGTTHSLAAVMTDHGPALIRNALGEVLTPSIIGFDDQDRLHVGRTAQELRVTRPERCAAVFKRHMGTDRKLNVAGKTLTPVELSSLVLRSLKQDAEAFLGTPVERAVITVPAYFNDNQRNATIEAARLIGLDVARILNEPTAAAIAYGLHESGDDKTVLVVDLGGGTFDVSVVQFFEGTLEIRASSGETFLGGEDITGILATRVLQQRGIALERAEMESPLLVSRLRRECEIAKRQLSRQSTYVIAVPGKDGEIGDGAPQVTVTRAELDEWSAPILDRIEGPIRRVLGDAGLTRHDVDEVLLVGGATRMPAFVARIRELFGREPRCSINPDEVVAQGAAIQAGLFASHAALNDLVVTDVAPFSLGVAVCRDIGGRSMDGYFLPIIHRNTTIPVSRVETVGTRTPNQTEIRVHVYQGESRMVADNLLIGEFEVGEIPLGPPGQEIDLRITYDLNGVLEVEATIKATKKKVTHIITRHAQKLSTGQIREAVAALQALKVDPRDQAENHYLLQRAARVFRELPPEVRGLLDDWITSFEAALEKRDPTAIATTRESLREFLDRIDPRPDEWGDEPQDRGGESEDGDGRRR